MTFDWSLVWRFLHLFFAFSFVGSLVVAEWNGRAARGTDDWRERALLFRIVYLSTNIAGLGGLIMAGVFGNLLSVIMGYRMSGDAWLQTVNGLWLVSALLMGLVNVPGAATLARISRTMADGDASAGEGAPEGAALDSAWSKALARWRLANVVQSILYLALLTLMVFRWRG